MAKIQCCIPGCENDVIGQCTGYEKPCNQYYCRNHSEGTLCANCAGQKAAAEKEKDLYTEYYYLSESIRQKAPQKSVVVILVLVVITCAFGLIDEIQSSVQNPFFIGFLALLTLFFSAWIVIYITKRKREQKEIYLDFVNTRPKFEWFYGGYKRYRFKQSLEKGRSAIGLAGAIGLNVVLSVLSKGRRRA